MILTSTRNDAGGLELYAILLQAEGDRMKKGEALALRAEQMTMSLPEGATLNDLTAIRVVIVTPDIVDEEAITTLVLAGKEPHPTREVEIVDLRPRTRSHSARRN